MSNVKKLAKLQMNYQAIQANKVHALGRQKGIALLEALIAILIFSMGVIALVGMQAAMKSNTSASKFRADASFLVQQRLGQLWADPANLATYAEANTDISVLIPDGKRTTTITNLANRQVTITVSWKVPGDAATHNETVQARVNVN